MRGHPSDLLFRQVQIRTRKFVSTSSSVTQGQLVGRGKVGTGKKIWATKRLVTVWGFRDA